MSKSVLIAYATRYGSTRDDIKSWADQLAAKL